MNKDADLLAEAYQKVLEEAMHCKYAKDGCDCDKCEECKENQTVKENFPANSPLMNDDMAAKKIADKVKGTPNLNMSTLKQYVAKYLPMVGKSPKDVDFIAANVHEILKDQGLMEAKKAKPDYLDLDKDGDKEESMKKAAADKKKKSMHKENAEMADAYQTILEFKHINKKFARRYNKVTAALLKAEPGSEQYGKLKSEREDLVNILKDHGQTPRDLEAFLQKKESENPLPEVQDYNPQTHNQYKDNSYTDTADLVANTEVSVAAAMENPSIEASAMAPDAPAQPAAEQ